MTEPIFEAEWDQARAVVHSLAPIKTSFSLSLSETLGHVVSRNIDARSDLPPFSASRVDGWAVSGAGPWTIVGDITAGHNTVESITPGQCVHIATGAALPIGANACLKDEESLTNRGVVTATQGAVELLVDEALPVGHDIRPIGYEAKQGEVVVPKGSRITPGVIGVIAAAGHDEVTVYEKVSVDILVFGDELLHSGASRQGKVRDSLGPQLPAWIEHIGGTLKTVTHVADTLEDHVQAIQNSDADLIITTGGTAAGPVDHLHQAITECGGQLAVDAVMIRPGYHQLFATLPTQFLLGLPGNPQSAIIGLLSLGAPFISGAYGIDLPDLPEYVAGKDMKAPANEIRMTLCTFDGEFVWPVEHLDSSMLRGFVKAQGFGLVPPGGLTAGERLRWLNLP